VSAFVVANVTASITRFISFEILRWGSMLRASLLTAFRHWPLVAVLGTVVVIYMALEVGRAVKPWASSNEDAAGKPVGAVVAIWSAAVGSGFIVTVGTLRGDADIDADLSVCFGSISSEAETGDGGQSKELEAIHIFTSANERGSDRE
jgi:hypothetical protein